MNLEIFKNNGYQIRGGLIDGEPYFVAKDVCDALGYSNSRQALAKLDDDEKGVRKIDTLGGDQEMAIVNESGLYSLILRSNKPEAKQFKKWVTSEVLPSIRKHGAYMTEQKIEEVLQDPDTIIRLAQNLKEEMQKRKQLEDKIERDKPKVSYANAVASTVNSCSIRDWIKSLRLPSGVKQKDIFAWLDSKYLYKTKRGERRARAEYEYKGYFELVPIVTATNAGSIERHQLKITGDGQIYLSTKLKEFLNQNNKEAA